MRQTRGEHVTVSLDDVFYGNFKHFPYDVFIFLVESLRTQCSICFSEQKPWASVLRLFCLLQELCCCCHLNWFLLFIQHSFRSLFKPWCNQLPTKTNLTIKHSSARVSCGDVSLWGEVDCKLGGVFYTVSVH